MTKEDILIQCTVGGNVVKLPNIQLERKLYQDVAKSLNLIGGKWVGGKTCGFVFNSDKMIAKLVIFSLRKSTI